MKKYIAALSEISFHIISALLVFIVLSILWFISYMDYQNMISNGYINNNSVKFKLNTKEVPIITESGDYLLYQYDENSEIKYVWVNGKIKLPPITMRTNTGVKKTAIVGQMADLHRVPPGFEVIGFFNHSKSYRLQSEIWLMSNNTHIKYENGEFFTLVVKNQDAKTVLARIINLNKIKIISSEMQGGYLLKSNRLVMNILLITMFLIVLLFVLFTIYSLKKRHVFFSILYIHGHSVVDIFEIVIKYRIIPFILLCLMIFIISLTVDVFFPLWDRLWIRNLVVFIFVFILIKVVMSFFMIFTYTVRKGGKKY